MTAKTRDELFLSFAQALGDLDFLVGTQLHPIAEIEAGRAAIRLVEMFLADDLDHARDRLAAGEKP